MKVLVTGANGFVGRNLCVVLGRREGLELLRYDVNNTPAELDAALQTADVIVHLAGVNRPQSLDEYQSGNAGLTQEICEKLVVAGKAPKIILSSSIQAELDNPYGTSKLQAEAAVRRYCAKTGASGIVYRFKNLFGKWCRPNYNSVTATFCHNIAHDLPVQISDTSKVMELTYIDDVVSSIVKEIDSASGSGFMFAAQLPSHSISLGELAATIQSFRDSRKTLLVPDFGDEFTKQLYATYLSYLDRGDFGYGLDIKTDNRGCLAEFVKASGFGQIFISRTKPGITRGNHYHHTKTEKFLVVEGEGVIRFRKLGCQDIVEYNVSGKDFKVVDIPPGYTHSIENTGNTEMVTLFWASEIFDPEHPETFFEQVYPSEE
ncbi:MAG: NAD-dependent epimerase/dehydratase family protein [Armatimonadota bacterium]